MQPGGDITLYPVGPCFGPQPKSRMHGGTGSGGKDQSVGAAYFSPAEQRSHCHPGSFGLSILCFHPVLLLSLCLQFRTIGNKPSFKEPPKSDQKLAGQSHDCDAPDST